MSLLFFYLFIRAFPELFVAQLFHVCGNNPDVSKGIHKVAGAVAVELVFDSHIALYCGPCVEGLPEYTVCIFYIQNNAYG